jgi:PII-like signaling protein
VTDYLKLTTYLGERQRHEAGFASDALLDLYARNAVATSVVLRGIAGFGPRHQLRSDQSLSGSEDLPVAIAAVDTETKMAGLAQQVVALTKRGLVTLERARLVDTEAPAVPSTAKLTIYVDRHERISGEPAFRALCNLLRARGFSCAAAFLGVDGTSRGERRRARFFSRNANVPVMVIAVGSSADVSEALQEIRRMVHEPLLTVERVQLCKRDGELLMRPPALPAVDDHGVPLWQKLMIYTAEDTLHDGEPIHRAIVRRLREPPGDLGATVLRGVWGFH